MGRAWRIEYEGGLYHVLSRGNDRKDIFYDDQDRRIRAGIVTRLVEYPWSSYKVCAYGDKAPGWLLTEPILDQFETEDKHKAYREKFSDMLMRRKNCGRIFCTA